MTTIEAGSGHPRTDTPTAGGRAVGVICTSRRPVARHGATRRGRAARRSRPWPMIAVTAVLFGLALAWGGWLASGGGLFSGGSPSMGTIAPVGSLVATQPLAARQALHVGEIIVFQPRPGSDTIIHRIYRALPDGRFMTKGDLNPGPDIWTITRAQIIGTPELIIPALGWIYKVSAWLFLGSAVVIIVTRVVRGPVRTWAAILGPVLIVALPFYRFRILVDGYVYGSSRVGRDVRVRLVSTGVLPARFSIPPGPSHYTVAGREVVVAGVLPKHHTQRLLTEAAALPKWGWGLVTMVCLLIPLVLKQSAQPAVSESAWQPPGALDRTPRHVRRGGLFGLVTGPWSGIGAKAHHRRRRHFA